MSVSSAQLQHQSYYIGWWRTELNKPGLFAIGKESRQGGYFILIGQSDGTSLSIPILILGNGHVRFQGDAFEAKGFVELITAKMGKECQNGNPRTKITQAYSRPGIILPEEQFQYLDHTFSTGTNALEGSFGSVSLAIWSKSENETKKIVARKFGSGDAGNKMLLREATLLARIAPHKNVVKFHGITVHSCLCMVMEYCPEMSMDFAIRNNPPMAKKLKWASNVAEGIAHLHKQGVAHRDVKCPNILIADDVAKIGDFGISTMTTEKILFDYDIKDYAENVLAVLFDLRIGLSEIRVEIGSSPTNNLPQDAKSPGVKPAEAEKVSASMLEGLYKLVERCRGGTCVQIPSAIELQEMLKKIK